MLNKYLARISDPTEYKLALRVINWDGESFGEEEREALLELYEKIFSDVGDKMVLTASLLVDLSGDPEQLDNTAEVFFIGGAVLEVLKDMGTLAQVKKMEDEDAAQWTKRALSYEESTVKGALCRLLLDKLAERSSYAEVGEEIGELSEYVRACEDSALSDGWFLTSVVKDVWRAQ